MDKKNTMVPMISYDTSFGREVQKIFRAPSVVPGSSSRNLDVEQGQELSSTVLNTS